MNGGATRRWPQVAASATAVALVLLVLPQPLRIPQNNPTASAEYAPVPGDSDASNVGNFAQTNQATTPGLGADPHGEGPLPGGAPPPVLPQFKPRQKECVGNPPRQSLDPLSPPCVPFFDGDNGGATHQGVTRDEIVVVLYNDRCCEGDMTAPWKPSDESRCTYPYECDHIVRTVKAQLRYFQRHYQTYGRRVRLIAQRSSSDIGSSCSQRQSDAEQFLTAHDAPFAAVYMDEGNRNCYMDVMRKHGVASFGLGFPLTLQGYAQRRPLVWGFFPGNEVREAWNAGMICRSLRGRQARFAGDPTFHDDTRTWGFIRPEGDSRGPELRESADLLEQELLAQCGMRFDVVERFDATVGSGVGAREAPDIISGFKRDGITTVVCYCIAVPTENTAPTMQKTATTFDYFPEWYWPCCLNSPAAYQTYGAREQKAFGTTTSWRQPAYHEQYHYQAYLEEEPGTQPNVFWNFSIYHLFLNLFQAIQAAGPVLTPDTLERGMFTFNYLDRSNPWLPIGGYGEYGSRAVAPFNFVDTAMAWWWDPDGTPPGGKRGEGCQRVMLDGLRFYAADWPRSDVNLFVPGAQCTEAASKILDASGGIPGA